MSQVRGTTVFSIQPNGTSTAGMSSLTPNFNNNRLVIAGQKIRYQVEWQAPATGTQALCTESMQPAASNYDAATGGDLVNVVFNIYMTTDIEAGNLPNWEKIAVIRKSRDIINKSPIVGVGTLVGQRFTIDISELVRNQLNYSLVPINKGTWKSSLYGGMNGGLAVQDNVTTPNPSQYNITRNGTFRIVRIQAEFEYMDGDGQIVLASGDNILSEDIGVINATAQFESDALYQRHQYELGDVVPIAAYNKTFMSRCPNQKFSGSGLPEMMKKVRIDETAEWLYFYAHSGQLIKVGGTVHTCDRAYIRIETYNAAGSGVETFYVKDFMDNYRLSGSNLHADQMRTFAQNVSVGYMSSNACDANGSSFSPTFTNVEYYAATLMYRITSSGAFTEMSNKSYYRIDREDEKLPYSFVRFHWLNRIGGIDSYTAKRDIVEGISISRDVIERKSVDRTYYQDNKTNNTDLAYSDYFSNTMRGGNLYKGGREVSNVNADRTQAAYTEPLNQTEAGWLEEIMTSPNVWIEMDTDATKRGNTVNSDQRPSTKGYIPVIINNGDVETVNQQAGLVSFNIQYTLAHKVQTQRN
tara:strand:+ start:1560 stop:3305 length:1746 start_codon:yes stop_codon:yes gene_type:complete